MSDPKFQTVDVLDGDVLTKQQPESAFRIMLRAAKKLRASDVHILADEHHWTIAARHLGACTTLATVPTEYGRSLINYIKANSGMDITEHRRPLDGRIVIEMDEHEVDLRISVIPTLYGQDMTLRLLDRDFGLLDLKELGMTRQQEDELISMLESPSGLLLVTGPTGAGKTTTLYAALRYLNDGRRKINTLEDPIEYALPGIRQSQVAPKIGLDFSTLLPSCLRQAPDVILIGEVRDEETAITAVRAANSGHLVLASLHAPVAAAAVESMLAFGIRPYFLANALRGVVAQRLVRVLCPSCRQGYDISESPLTFSEIEHLLDGREASKLYMSSGCAECSQRGYISQTGIFEILRPNAAMRQAIADRAPRQSIERMALQEGMVNLRQAALLKISTGETSFDEVMRCVPVEHLAVD